MSSFFLSFFPLSFQMLFTLPNAEPTFPESLSICHIPMQQKSPLCHTSSIQSMLDVTLCFPAVVLKSHTLVIKFTLFFHLLVACQRLWSYDLMVLYKSVYYYYYITWNVSFELNSLGKGEMTSDWVKVYIICKSNLKNVVESTGSAVFCRYIVECYQFTIFTFIQCACACVRLVELCFVPVIAVIIHNKHIYCRRPPFVHHSLYGVLHSEVFEAL